jgi:hypothetical protein
MRIESDKSALSYLKCREKSRVRHHRSAGGVADGENMNHSVYMAWWESASASRDIHLRGG